MKKINCLVIDDEPLACKGLVEYIGEVDALHCLAAVHRANDAINYLADTDLMYLDINMPKISGIDFLKQLKTPPLTIITTAYEQYALEGFELDVVDYLLKPISFPRFLKATTKALDFLRLKQGEKPVPENPEDYFFVKCNGVLEKIIVNEILAVESLANYIIIHCVEKKIITWVTLKMVKEHLSPEKFIQVHKSYIVARNRIDKIGMHSLHVRHLEIPLGGNYKEAVEREIAGKLLKR